MTIDVMKDKRGYIPKGVIETKILPACEDIRELAVIQTLWRTGVRVSELLSIKKQNILFEINV